MEFSTSVTGVVPLPGSKDVLSDILRQGAQHMLSKAIEAEVAEWLQAHAYERDERGRQQVVRNGYLPDRTILTGIGPVEVKQPRVHDRRPPRQFR